MAHLQRTLRGAVEHRGVGIGTRLIHVEQLEVPAGQAIVDSRTRASIALRMALEALPPLLVRVVIRRTLGLALFTPLVVGALGADLFMVSIVGAKLAQGMTLPADGPAGQRLQRPLLLRMHILPEVAIRALVVLQQAALHRGIRVDNGQVAGLAGSQTDGVIGPSASIAGGMALPADSVVIVLVSGTLGHTVRPVPHMDALLAVIRSSSRARLALGMARLAGLIIELEGTVIGKRKSVSWLVYILPGGCYVTYLEILPQSAMQVPLKLKFLQVRH